MENRKSKIVNRKWIFACLALAFVCMNALADDGYSYLYWLVDETESAEQIPFAYATLTESSTGAAIDTLWANSYAESDKLGITAGYSPVGWGSDLGDYANSAYSFYVEIFGLNNESLGLSSTLSYLALYSSGYLGTGGIGTQATAAWEVSAFTVPEPTSGMLFLLGLAGLALRRKRGGHAGRVTLPCLLSLVASLLSFSLFGAANDTLIVFSTPGPDTYRDGTTVLDNECYALVWTAAGSTFGGLTGDGKCVCTADRLVAVAPIAENGRCPETVFEIDAELAKSFQGGTFALYLLDTRVRSAAGAVALAPFENGFPKVVNAYADAASCTGDGGKLVASSSLSLAKVGVLSEIASPVITSIQLKGAKIEIKTKGLSSAADYYVVGGADLKLRNVLKSERTSDDVFTVDADDAKSGFFSIKGTRKFE